jgi:Tol biopolymer transport system component
VSDLWLHDWSPDGKYLALSVQRADNSMQIGLVSVSDGSFYALKSLEWPGPGTMRFSPDGKYLAYDAPQAQTGSEKDIFILALDGSREFRSVSNESNDVLVGWSPDGKWLLFTSDRWGTTDLWGASVSDGKTIGQPLQLRSNIGAGFRPMGWTPFGALYYKTSQGGGDSTSRLQLASLDWNTGLLSSAPVGTRGYLENSSQSAWSPDGKSLAYLSTLRGRAGNESPLLAIRSVATGSTRELRPKQLSTIGVVEGWSPDGRALWVVANDTKGPELDLGDGLYRIDVETGDAVAVIQYDQYDPKIITRGMNWLPDGRSFITQRADRKPGGPPTAYVSYRVDAITGRMTPVGANEPPSRTSPLSPDGLIQYTRRPSPAQNGVAESVAFVKRNMTTGEETELIRRSFLGNIQLSPDGRYIGTASTDPASNSRVLLLIPVDGGEVRELMRVPAEVVGRVSVDWKSDSSAVLARINPTDQTKDAEFWLVPLNQSKPKRVEGGVPAGTAISVSPDRLHFTYTKIEEAPPSTQEIAVLENFLPKTAK